MHYTEFFGVTILSMSMFKCAGYAIMALISYLFKKEFHKSFLDKRYCELILTFCLN